MRVHGHLAVRELPAHAEHALLRFRVEVDGTPVWFRATIEGAAGEQGECAFRSFVCPAPQAAIKALVAEKYLDFPDAHYEFVTVTDLGYDLTSLGLLGTRIFLCGPGQSVRERAQELRTFVATLGEGRTGAPDRRRLRQDAGAARQFGAGSLAMAGAPAPEEVASIVPLDQWSRLLATLARLFGDCAGSYHRPPRDGFSNGRAGVMFDRLLADLAALALASRALVVSDGEANAEIQAVLDTFSRANG